MSDPDTPEPAEKPKKSKLPLLVGVVLALMLGGGGFYAVQSGLILSTDASHGSGHDAAAADDGDALPEDIAFVPIEPLIVSLGPDSASRHLRFAAQLEVSTEHQADVALLMPRVLDVLNGYLRALDMAELSDPTVLIRLRAQMLRRVQIVVGEGRVRDLLVTEFVLN